MRFAVKDNDFNEKKREDLNVLIQSKNKSIDILSFIEDIASD